MKVLSRLHCRGRHNVVAVGVGIESPCGALDVYVHASAHTPTSCHRVVVMIPDCLYQSHRVSTDPFAFLYPDHCLQSMHCTTPLHPLHIIYIHLLSVFYLSTNGHITFYLSIHGLVTSGSFLPVLSLPPFRVPLMYISRLLARSFRVLFAL